MNTRNLALLLLCLTLFSVPVVAGTLYENGPLNGDFDAWTVNGGFVVSDTFFLTGASTVTGFVFNAWVYPGDVLTSAEISITSMENGGTTYFDQVVPFVQSNCFSNAYGLEVCTETANFNGTTLNSGSLWLNLQNASVPNGDTVYWDENDGSGCHSPGCPSLASENMVGMIGSESFTIMGSASSGTTPEPSSILLLGSGILGVAALLRRKRF